MSAPEEKSTLALPAPGEQSTEGNKNEVKQLDVGNGQTIQMDSLGPILVNTDGTLSRISNWHQMTQQEQERTLRLVIKRRNQDRLRVLREAEQGDQAQENKTD